MRKRKREKSIPFARRRGYSLRIFFHLVLCNGNFKADEGFVLDFCQNLVFFEILPSQLPYEFSKYGTYFILEKIVHSTFFLLCSHREELRGIKRANNAKDVDWNKVAKSVSYETITKPPAIKIDVSEVLQKVKSTQVASTAASTIVSQNGT